MPNVLEALKPAMPSVKDRFEVYGELMNALALAGVNRIAMFLSVFAQASLGHSPAPKTAFEGGSYNPSASLKVPLCKTPETNDCGIEEVIGKLNGLGCREIMSSTNY